MKIKSSRARGISISLTTAMFVTLLALQLTGHIDWEWYWIVAPLWVPAAVVIAMLLAIMIGIVVFVIPIAALVDWVRRRRRVARVRAPAKRKARR